MYAPSRPGRGAAGWVSNPTPKVYTCW